MNEQDTNLTRYDSTRSGFVALVGAPNAGKSTLVNQLVGAKVSIVTHKVQTTRNLIRGIAIHQQTQIVLVDTPGIFAPKKRLDRAMVRAALSGAKDADMVLVIIDVQAGFDEVAQKLLAQLPQMSKPKILILNKIDRINPPALLALSETINQQSHFDRTFMISALKGSGCADVLDYVAAHLPQGPFYYDEDQISDQPMRQLAAEITREKLYIRLHEELPYESTVETEGWQEKEKSIRIEQVIYVARDSQKKIVLGRGGQTIKAIGQAARQEMAQAFGKKVHLFLFVKVRENWIDDPERYREMGLDFHS